MCDVLRNGKERAVGMPPTPPTTSHHLCVLHGYYPARAQHARAEGPSGLTKLRSHLHLFSFVLSSDALLLRHWLRHYHGLGVRPDHTHIAIRVDESQPAPNEVLRTLDDGGVPKSHVRVIRSPPSDALKVDLINSLVNSLPRKRSWFIYADVDELFDYPCGQNLRQHPCVAGSMWDQMAANGNISEMREAPDLAQQYPLQCRVRQRVARMKFTKNILVNVGGGGRGMGLGLSPRRFFDTHSVNGTCALGGIVRHYSMTAQQLKALELKADTVELSKAQRRPLAQVAAFRNTSNFAGGQCGTMDKRTGRCLDYSILGDFMASRVKAFKDGTLNPRAGCPRNLTVVPTFACDAECKLYMEATFGYRP